MKKILSMALCLMMLGILGGCASGSSKLELGEESTIVPNKELDISLEITEGSVTPTSLKASVKNNSGVQINCGNERDFYIEVLEGDKWFTIKTGERINTLEMYYFDESQELSFDWSEIYGKLPKGHYRIVKQFYPMNSEENYAIKDPFYLGAEFDIK